MLDRYKLPWLVYRMLFPSLQLLFYATAFIIKSALYGTYEPISYKKVTENMPAFLRLDLHINHETGLS